MNNNNNNSKKYSNKFKWKQTEKFVIIIYFQIEKYIVHFSLNSDSDQSKYLFNKKWITKFEQSEKKIDKIKWENILIK